MIRRIIIYLIGLLTLAFGTSFTIQSDLGVSPVSSLPFVISEATSLNIGLMSALFFTGLVVFQIAILGRKFKWLNLIQLPFVFVFGYFLNFAVWVMYGVQFPTYFGRLGMLAVGIVLIALGIVLMICARIIVLPPEALCQALEQRFERVKFHKAKMVMDCVIVVLSISISLIFLSELVGVREGTVISAILIGKIIPYIKKLIDPIINRILKTPQT
ncbi:MAG: DUF6198 family protein [Defluviitaleaceae bacterium]|nr:DUF6198 family protein [Defluviitaleaceae bacterium]